MKPVRLFLCVLFVLAASSPLVWSDSAIPRRANIILIVADGLGTGDLSCYGQTQFQTPNLDKLAAGGIRFNNYLAGGVADSPALASLVIGKNTSHLSGMDYSLTANDITVAQLLKDSGYRTCLLGGWTLGDQNSDGAPWRHGFGEFAGCFDSTDAENPYPSSIWRYCPRFNTTDNKMGIYNDHETIYKNADGKNAEYTSDLLTDWAINYIRNNQPQWYNHYRPFFLVMHYSVPGNGNHVVPSDAPFSEESWPQAEKNRAAVISRLDGHIGQLLEQLKKFNQSSNTVVFFTSDTTPQKSDGVDPKFFHENSSPDDLHVPLIVSWPGEIPAGQVSSLECSARDFLPTAANLAYLKPPKGIDGTSFSPALFGQNNK
jgi:arylsulfatase A-like enzyme